MYRRFSFFDVMLIAMVSLIIVISTPALGTPALSNGRTASLAELPVQQPSVAALKAADASKLLLNAGVFDPTQQQLIDAAFDFQTPQRPALADQRYFIAQFELGKLPRLSWFQKRDIAVIGYVPNNAYLLMLDQSQQTAVLATAGLRYFGPWHAEYKISAVVRDAALAKQDISLEVIGFAGASVDALKAAVPIARMPTNTTAFRQSARLSRMRLPVRGADLGELVQRLALHPEVAWIDQFELPRANNVDAVGPIQSGLPSAPVGGVPSAIAASIWARGLLGTGQVIAVVDSGLDRNQAFFNRYIKNGVLNTEVTNASDTTPPIPGPVFPQRKVFGYFNMPGATAYDDDRICPGGAPSAFHGTHTSGTAVGDSGTAATATAANYNNGDGMAPNAQILFQDIGNDATGCLTGETGVDQFIQARNAGAMISSNSYGAPFVSSPYYNVRDAEVDTALWQTQDLLIAFSAGNFGQGAMTIDHPAHAKHALTVGALEHGEATQVAAYSSRGPTSDGRLKPDIQAPGSGTVSALGDDDDSNPPNNIENANTQVLSGTSMSTPTVAGGALLMRQYFVDGWYPTGASTAADRRKPLGAEMKAVLLNGTALIGSAPDNNYGWGRIFLDNNLYFTGDSRRMRSFAFRHEAGLEQGEVASFQVSVGANQDARVSLVWFDPQATIGVARALVNNLDLEVIDGANTYKGNVFVGSGATVTSQTGGVADSINPVEQVILPAAIVNTVRTLTIRVRATQIPGNGVFGSDRQGYALVVSGGALTTPTLAAPSLQVRNAGAVVIADVAAVAGASSYQIYRAAGSCAQAAVDDFQLIGVTDSPSFSDRSASGGFSFAYKARAATPASEGAISSCVDIVSTGNCRLEPRFDASTLSVTQNQASECTTTLRWNPGQSLCPNAPAVRYSIYRATDPFFVPAAGNRIASNITTNQYQDFSSASLTTYYYAVRAEDATAGNLGPNGGNESQNDTRVRYTPRGVGSSIGNYFDGADSPSLVNYQLPWSASTRQFFQGALSHRNATRTDVTYPANRCAAVTTPAMTLASNANLSYRARFDLEAQWDGVVVEISADGGLTWQDLPPSVGYPDTFAQTGSPPANACGFPAEKAAFTGSSNGLFEAHTSSLAAFAGQNIQIRWRFSSDPGVEEEGFYLDNIQVSNASVPNACAVTGFLFRDSFE
jgi:hypothetical protein